MSDLEGFDPDDIAELEARAKKLEHELLTSYEITIIVSHESATEFIRNYNAAKYGDMKATYAMMQVLYVLASSIKSAIEADYDDTDEGL